MLDHGGNLHDAIQRYGRPREQWLDLSTGINPNGYPAPQLAHDVWHRLPEPSDALLRAAQSYYRASSLLPVAGTQAAIQSLPRLRASCRVVVAAPSYGEHAHAWRQGGHDVREVSFDRLDAAVDDCDVMVICNPNNPTGEQIEPALLLQWHRGLAQRGGWLIVDEAFGDMTPDASVAPSASQAGLIVLRSIGKFFGLAGLRLGFVCAEPTLLKQLADLLGPWAVSGPAQQIGTAALVDRDWQAKTQTRLIEDGARLQQLLARSGIASNGTALYQYWPEARAMDFAQCMAEQGIWIRQFTHGVRLGLPPNEAGWQRLDDALARWTSLNKLQTVLA